MADPAAVDLPTISVESFEILRSDWEALARASHAPPFDWPQWFDSWRQSLAFSPSLPAALSDLHLAVRRDGVLVGIAALAPGERTARQLGDPTITDYASPLAAPGEEEAVAAGVIEWLVEDLTVGLDLWGVPEDSPMRLAFRVAAERFGWSYDELDEAICPRVMLPGGFEAYVRSLSKQARHEVRRKMRHLVAAGTVQYESVTGRAAILGQFDRFLELMRASRDDKAAFFTPQREVFFRALADELGDLEIARLGTLRLNGREVAMVFCFEDETSTYLYNSGYDPEFAHLAVGLLSKVCAIRDSIARGKQVFDFLRGDEEYKRHLGGVPQRVLTLRLRA